MKFSFGKNWTRFLNKYYNLDSLTVAMESIQQFLEIDSLKNLEVLDIGCGSGIFSLAAHRLGATKITSFDVDHLSVECCRRLKERVDSPASWRVEQGSILDEIFLRTIPEADLVYSWGVLHHTGNMWQAIRLAASKVKPGGKFYFAVYNDVPGFLGSNFWAREKRIYNKLPRFAQHLLAAGYMIADIIVTFSRRQNPIKKIKKYRSQRGMGWYVDIIDWLGGYPYEYASASQVTNFCEKQLSLKLVKVAPTSNLGNHEFLFKRPQ